jgi:hypothetical protein
MLLEPDEQLDGVVAGEAADSTGAVLVDAGEEIGGVAGLEGAVAL